MTDPLSLESRKTVIIHTLEALLVLLIGIKLLKIRSLYLAKYGPNNIIAANKTEASQPAKHPEAFTKPQAKTKPFLKTLPEPEVVFSPKHEKIIAAETPQISEKKSVLNDYIDDFFFDTTEPSKETMSFHSQELSSSNDDEFITIQEESTQLVRAMESLKKEIGIPAQG